MKPEGGFGGASFAPPPAPWVTRAIIALCVAIQIAASLGGPAFATALVDHAGLIPARLTGAVPAQPGDVPAALTLVTALFLHAGWIHLTLNLSFLLWVGRHVEVVAGRTRFIALYFLSGLAGGLLQVAVGPGSTAPVIGASGAIAGVFGAYAVLFAQRRAAPRQVFGRTIGAEVVTGLWYLATWIGLQLLTAVAFNTGHGGIAIWTHIGGFIVGLIAAQPIARRLQRTGLPDSRIG